MPPDRPERARTPTPPSGGSRHTSTLRWSVGAESWQRQERLLAKMRGWVDRRTACCQRIVLVSGTPFVPGVAPGFWQRPEDRTSLGSPAEWGADAAPLEIPFLVNSPHRGGEFRRLSGSCSPPPPLDRGPLPAFQRLAGPAGTIHVRPAI